MRATLAQAILPAAPGGVIDVPVDIHNTSDVVDAISAQVHGLDPYCVTAAPDSLALFPDTGGTLTLRLRIPRELPAGPRSIRIELCSSADPTDCEVLDLVLDVIPAVEGRLELRPSVVRTRRRSKVAVYCANVGNRPFSMALTAHDRERAVRFAFVPSILDVEPGSEAGGWLHLRVRRRLFGAERTSAFTVEATSTELELSATATLTQRPLIARGVVTAALLALIVAIWAIAVLFAVRSVLDDDPVPRLVPAGFVGAEADGVGGAGGGAGAGSASADKLAAIAGAAVELPGTVVADSNGEGVPRVLVQAVREGGEPPFRATAATDENGAFALRELVPGRYQLRFSAEGFETATYPDVVQVGGDAPIEELEMVLDGEPATVTGTVGFASSGGVVPDGTIVEMRTEPGEPAVATGSVAADGAFSLDGVPAPATYELSALAPGFEAVIVPVVVSGGEAVELGLVPLTAGEGSISGVVTDGTRPLGGVSIRAALGAVEAETTSVTDGEVGAFQLTDLPTPGRYILTFSIDGFGATTTVVELGPAEVVTELRVVLAAGAGAVTGTVIDPDGSPVAGAAVSVAGRDPVVTDDAGGFAIGELDAPGRYTLVVEAAGFAPASLPITLDETGTAEVEVALEAVAGRIIGTVTGPEPVEGAAVRAGGVETTTDTDGTFVLDGLRPGQLRVSVQADGFTDREITADVVEGGETVVTIRLEPAREPSP